MFFCAREPCEIGKINEVYQEKEKNPQASGEGLRTNSQHRFCATAHFRFTILCDVFFSQRMIDASLCMTQTMNGWLVRIRGEPRRLYSPEDISASVQGTSEGYLRLGGTISFSVPDCITSAESCNL